MPGSAALAWPSEVTWYFSHITSHHSQLKLDTSTSNFTHDTSVIDNMDEQPVAIRLMHPALYATALGSSQTSAPGMRIPDMCLCTPERPECQPLTVNNMQMASVHGSHSCVFCCP